jgi:hypothetical protein
MYVLLCIAIALALVLASTYLPPRSRTHCRCGARADIQDDQRPWLVYCASCYRKQLRKKGIEL